MNREDDALHVVGEAKWDGDLLQTLAERAAEMAYRRGYQQGFYRARAYIEHGASLQEVARYEVKRIHPWRMRGWRQNHQRYEEPPDDIFRRRSQS
jgi:hypothetical protein